MAPVLRESKARKTKKMEDSAVLHPLPPSTSSDLTSEPINSQCSEYSEIDSQSQEPSQEVEAASLLIQQQVQGMSTHDLINNPSTLQAGLSVLNDHMAQAAFKPLVIASSSSYGSGPSTSGPSTFAANVVKVRKRGRKRPGSVETSGDSHPFADNNPLRPCRNEEEQDILGDLPDRFVGTSSPCPSAGSCSSAFSTTSGSSRSSGFTEEFVKKGGEKGVAQFGELCRRFKLPESPMSPAKRLEEFDLEKSNNIFLRSVFKDYDQKEKMYEKHRKKIEDLNTETTLEHFERIKVFLLDIFEGRLQSPRMEMYVSDNQDDLSALKGMCISAPFLNPIYMYVASQITDFLLPRKKSKQKYLELIQLVLIPECLIRIYASVNGIEYAHAEKEMRFGPQYDGNSYEYSKKRKGNRRKRAKKATEMETRTEMQQDSTNNEDTFSSARSGIGSKDERCGSAVKNK